MDLQCVALVIEANREMAREDASDGAVIREPITSKHTTPPYPDTHPADPCVPGRLQGL